jgi:hypothetical protein
MTRKSLVLSLMTLLVANASVALACEYKAGESKFADYAKCRYGEDSIQIVKMPEGSHWESCVYYLEAFRPPKLLAVTQEKDGEELASINNRKQIGNPCYLTKQHCDAALKALD